MQGLCDYLLDYDFTSCFSSMNVELIWSELKSIIISAIHNFAPTVKPRCRQTLKWFTSQIRHRLNCIHSLRRKAKSRPSPHYLAKLKNSESQLAEEIQSAKLSYESNLVQDFATINSNKIYKYMNSLLKHDTIPPIMHHESSEAFSNKDKASLFNQYFQSVFTTSSFILPPLNDLPCPSAVLNNILVSEVEVYDALVSLNPNKAMGVDCIGPKVLKTCAIALYLPIHHLFSHVHLNTNFQRNGRSIGLHLYLNQVTSLKTCAIALYLPIHHLFSHVHLNTNFQRNGRSIGLHLYLNQVTSLTYNVRTLTRHVRISMCVCARARSRRCAAAPAVPAWTLPPYVTVYAETNHML